MPMRWPAKREVLILIPTAESFGKIIDCRKLSLEGRFYCLSEEKMIELAKSIFSFIDRRFGESCVLLWKCNDRAVKTIDDINAKAVKNDGIFDLSVFGDVKSSLVYNKTSLRVYDRRLLYDPVYTLGLAPGDASADYPAYSQRELEPCKNDTAMLREAVMRIFSEEGRINKNLFSQHDVEGAFFAYHMEEQAELFSGEFKLHISCFSLGDELDNMAAELYKFGQLVALDFTNVNMVIGIMQTDSDWDRYFGTLNTDEADDETGFMMRCRAEFMYLHKVGWANIISPTVSRLLPDESKALFNTLENGAVCARLGCTASETTLKALKRLKTELYPALLPGWAEFELDCLRIRPYWENVVVLDSELCFENGNMVLAQNGKADGDYLLRNEIFV